MLPKTNTKPKWLAIEQRGSGKDFPLMPAALIVYKTANGKAFTKITGIKCSDFLLDFSLDAVRNYAREDQWNRFCNQCYKKIKETPDFQKKLIKEFKKRVSRFLRFCKKVYQSDLSQKADQELWQYYEKYIGLYEDIYVWGESFAFGARFKLSDCLSDYLKKILKKKNQVEKFSEYFDILITPPQKPFITEEREGLLKIALKINRNPKLKKLFKKDLKSVNKEIEKFPTINKEIEKHREDYQWAPYNYGAYLYTKKHFLKELRDLISKNKAKEELNKIKKRYGNLSGKQREIIKELKIDKYHQKLFEALRWNSFIIDYKKKVFTISHFLINLSLMKEIAKRLKIEQKYAHCLLEDEMKKTLLENKLVPLEILKERFKRSVAFVKEGKIKLMVGREADDFLKRQGVKEEKKLGVKKLKGQIASSGRVEGIAKIIPGPRDFKKMKQGNILVAHMTTPEFAPIFKKAKAIVTDEGGITCHAAIISRELNIPCIIGTKIATVVLHDGDLVEVNADKGIVKIVKK